MRDTQRSAIISTQLRQIAEQAIEHPDRVFTTLIHRMDVDFLREAYYRLRKDGAPGLSGVTAKDYGKELEANLADLYERLKTQRYVAPPIKRVWIDKEGGKKRPIGLLEIEDKIVQKAVSMLMRIPVKSATQSTANRPPGPGQSGHPQGDSETQGK